MARRVTETVADTEAFQSISAPMSHALTFKVALVDSEDRGQWLAHLQYFAALGFLLFLLLLERLLLLLVESCAPSKFFRPVVRSL